MIIFLIGIKTNKVVSVLHKMKAFNKRKLKCDYTKTILIFLT